MHGGNVRSAGTNGLRLAAITKFLRFVSVVGKSLKTLLRGNHERTEITGVDRGVRRAVQVVS